MSEQGDCWATAVAMLAGLDARARNELHRRIVLSDLAMARAGGAAREGGGWWNVTQRFLAERGFDPVCWWNADHPGFSPDPETVYIVTGPSPRGDWLHSVLTYGDGRLFADPHPSDDGVVEVYEYVWWWRESA